MPKMAIAVETEPETDVINFYNRGEDRGSGSDGIKRDFHHPYTPYSIQEDFMSSVYAVLECGEGGVGIFESPTGTGKSLSLICATMTWLRDFKRRKFEVGLDRDEEDASEPEWIVEQARARRRRELIRGREDLEIRLEGVRRKERELRKAFLKGEREGLGKRRKVGDAGERDRSGKDVGNGDEEFVLDEWESGDEEGGRRRDVGEESGLSKETRALMEKMGMGVPGTARRRDEEDEGEEEIKIYYCSRTHSQLTQFINELRRVHIPSSFPPSTTGSKPPIEPFKHLTLGSRKNLCIHSPVSKLSSATAINERCTELQASSTPAEKKCPHLPNTSNQALVNEFRDNTLARILDIEELPVLGKSIGICPYYASRSAIKASEIITLPYPLLLQKSAREALGIKLEGNVVVVDEAHNVMDALAGIYGCEVTLEGIKKADVMVRGYVKKFGLKLKGGNRVYIAQVIRVLESLMRALEEKVGKGMPLEGTIETADLLKGKGVDQINLFKLLKYLQESKLARKVEGYSQYAAESTATNPSTTQHKPTSEAAPPTLHPITALLTALTNPSKEGQLFYSHDPASPASTTLRYLLLDPTHHFSEIVSSARAVILAGGTMSPMSDYTSHLLSYLPSTKITTLSCGHVIPNTNLLAWTLARGPSGKNFEFTFAKRQGIEGEEMLDDLGRALLNVCTVVPDGVVVFFPSYAFLETAVTRWSLPSSTPNIWDRLGKKKVLFQESKTSGTGGEDVLTEYAKAIDANRGGLLLSVVGGKMSEGINFSDRLGRCVLIVGLPFPNVQSAEWRAKMRYIETATMERLAPTTNKEEAAKEGKRLAREFYENACMRAVNQSIGRAIRHREDYAAIVMVDVRFGKDGVRGKLPGWIKGGLVDGCEAKGFGELMGALSAFFRGKRD